MRHAQKCQEPPCQAAPSDRKKPTVLHVTPEGHPQAPGIARHLADAQARGRQAELAGCYLAAREARRVAHRLRRKLTSTPDAVARWLPIGDVVQWAGRQGSGR
jgi:hypothetical protein